MGLVDDVGSAVQSVGDTITDAADGAGDAIESATDNTIGQVPVLGDAASLGADAVDAQLDAVGTLAGAQYQVAGGAIKLSDDAAAAVGDAAGAAADAIPDPVKDIGSDVVDVVASGSFGRMANTTLDKMGAPDIVGDVVGTGIDVGVTVGLAAGAIPTAGATAPAVAVSGAGAVSNAMDALENVAGPDSTAGEWLKAGSNITGMFSGPAGVGALVSAGGRTLTKADDAARLLGKADDAIGIGGRAAGWMDEAARAGTKMDDIARAAAKGDDMGRVASHIRKADQFGLAGRLKDGAAAINNLQDGNYLGAASAGLSAAAPGAYNPAGSKLNDLAAQLPGVAKGADEASWVARSVGQNVPGLTAQGARVGEAVLKSSAIGAGILDKLPDGAVDFSAPTDQIVEQLKSNPDFDVQGQEPMVRPGIEMARQCHQNPGAPAHQPMMNEQVLRACAGCARHCQQAQGISSDEMLCEFNADTGRLDGPAGRFIQGNMELSAGIMRVAQQDPGCAQMLMDVMEQNQTMVDDIDLQSRHAAHLHP